ncbi:hypothetical protein ACHABQ_12130 [Nesterenkonia aurantiaca]|uniref:hypothetical protein n=1 Tax=Nesterenkonia aurantiaca TaxID=1436010 RepID=UPI003EE6EFB5
MNTTSKRQKVGLVLAGIYNATSIPSVMFPESGGEVGPPMGILVIGSVLGVVGLVAVIVAWRTGSRAALRVAAGATIIITLTALPAFFVDVSAGVKLLVGVSVLFTITAVVLMFSPARRPMPVLD